MIRLLAGLLLMPHIADAGIPKTLQLAGAFPTTHRSDAPTYKNKPKAPTKRTNGIVADYVNQAVITTYWAKGRKTDAWTRKRQSSTGVQLVSGLHVAVDPKVFKYGTRIRIDGVGEFECVDTGRDVRKRRAAKLRGLPELPVIDIFFDTEADAKRFSESFEKTNRAIGRIKILEANV